MRFFGNSSSKDVEEYFTSMEATWETDKNELSLGEENVHFSGKTDVHGKKYHILSVGYHLQSLEILGDLVPTALEIMDTLLKECFVFTQIYEIPTPYKRRKKTEQIFYPTFAKSYITCLEAHDWQDGECFYDGKESFTTLTKVLLSRTICHASKQRLK